MDKSMVNELSHLVTSNVQYSRSSFIHTVYETDFNELRKSRIQNLPNYRKQDLSGKLNFVVVFQAIEIERLSVEIETLRVKIKDFERQLGNYENYEVQIRELTEKCHSYELQRQDHQEAMEKMHKVCQQLYNELEEMRARYADIDLSLKEKYRLEKERSSMLGSEVEKWKARYNAAESSKAKELEDMRMMLENQRKSMVQREMRELSVKHQAQRSMLQTQLRKLRQNLQNRIYEIQRMRMELQQSQVRENELRQYQQRLDQYEDKLMMMAQQNMRLNQLLRMKKQQIQQLKSNERNLQNRLQNLSRVQQEFLTVTKKLQSYQQDIRQWAQKYSRLQAENNRAMILASKAQEYERLLDNSAAEMQRMNTIIREKLSEIEKYKAANQNLSIQLQESRNIQQKLNEYQEIIQQMQGENQRLNEVMKSRLQELQGWKGKCEQMQSKIPLMTQAQNQAKNLKEKLAVEVSTRTKLSQTISSLQKDLSKAADMEQTLIRERAANKDLQRQVQRLNGSIKNLSSQNSDLTKKIQGLQQQLKDNSGIIDQLQQCKKTIAMMTQQLDRINGTLHQKIQQLKQLKQSYASVSNNTARYRQIQEQFLTNLQQTEQLVLKLDESRRENECVNEKLLNVEGRCKKLESEIFTNNEEKDKLIGIVNQKKIELEDLVARLEKSQQKLATLLNVQQQYKSLKTAYEKLDTKLKDTQARYAKQSKRSEDFSNQVESLTVELMKLKNQSNFSKQFIAEFNTIKTQSQQKDQLIALLMQKVQTVEKCIGLLKQQLKKNYNEMCQQQSKWKSINANVESVNVFMDKFFEIQEKMTKLAEDNIKLESSVNMMNIEMAESQYASQNSYKKIEDQRSSITPQTSSVIYSQRPQSQHKTSTTTIISYTQAQRQKQFQKQRPSAIYEQKSSITTYQQQESQSQKPSSPYIQYIMTDRQATSPQSPSNKLATIEEQCSRQSLRGTYDSNPNASNIIGTSVAYDTNQSNGIGSNGYYESQVRQYYGSNVYQPGMYSGSMISGSKSPQTYYQRPQSFGSKQIRPGSSHQASSYAYSSNYSNYQSPYQSNYSYRVTSPVTSQQKIHTSGVSSPTNTYTTTTSYSSSSQSIPTSHVNHHFSNVTNIERPQSFVKNGKYSEVRTSPDTKEQLGYQVGSDGRRAVLSPVRFLN